MTWFDNKWFRLGRPRQVPHRDTRPFPAYLPLGQQPGALRRAIFKPTPRNLRMFGKHPYARRAINAIKNPIMELKWEVKPLDGVDLNSELRRQIDIATGIFEKPNQDDDYHAFGQQVLEDMFFGAGAIETQPCSDPTRPLFMWPVDGLSIQLYPNWNGSKNQPRYLQTMGYGGYSQPNAPIPLRDDELIYIKPNPSTSTPFGLGPMEVAFDSISRKLGAERYAGQVASNSGPPYALDVGRESEEFLLAFRKWWRDSIEGRGEIPIWADTSGRAVDDKKPSINAIPLKPSGDEALYLAWQELLGREIGTSFDLSPQNFGIERDVNRNTSEVAEDRDWDQAIKPWAKFYARVLTNSVIRGRLGFSQLQFVHEGLDREDELSTAQIYDLRFKSNSITGNQIREHFGEDPLPNVTADMTAADIEVMKAAARSVGEQLDPDLPDAGTGSDKDKPLPQPTAKRKLIPARKRTAKET